jgi:hypothetical protein
MYRITLALSLLLLCWELCDRFMLVTSYSLVTANRRTRRAVTFDFAAAATDTTSTKSLIPLTDRQLQFWEDVDDGLNDIESFWDKKGQNIDRIRQFALRYVVVVVL